ncbi:MAG: hypothetical protein KAW46_06890 [candidate division Zixibacteria bacterium]|nr:hypothetical protein [candidate division Zixibacteria bacterium]
MLKVFLLVAFFLICNAQSHGETLLVVSEDSIVFDKEDIERKMGYDEHQVGAYIEEDLALVGVANGVYARLSPDAPWKKLLDCRQRGDNWGSDFQVAMQTSVLFYPTQFWRTPGADSFLVWDDYMIAPYSMSLGDDQVRIKYLESYDEAIGKVYVDNVSECNGRLLGGKISVGNEIIVIMLSADMSGCRDGYRCPMSLSDSLGRLGYGTRETYPVFNPVDSSIWIAFFAYGYIYVVDMHGQLLDSIPVAGDDFRLPKPPRSRMKSKAVTREWHANFTRVESFSYAPPGYFLFQYRIGWEKLAVDSLPLFSTITWSADRKPVELDLDKRWQVAGVQPDGRVIFTRYLLEDRRAVGLILTEARIEP